jgi:hypothetical protein
LPFDRNVFGIRSDDFSVLWLELPRFRGQVSVLVL